MQGRTTHIQERRNAAQAVMKQTAKALGITDTAYSWRMYRYGLAFLRFYTSPIERRMYEESKVFWNWWKIQWVMREEGFATTLMGQNPEQRIWLWEKLHDPHILSQERTPNGIILGDNWSVMRRQAQQEADKKAQRAQDMQWVDELLKVNVLSGQV